MTGQYDYLIDTNLITTLVRKTANGHDKAIAALESIGDGKILISAITIGEILFGFGKVKNPNSKQLEERANIQNFLQAYDIVPFTEHSAEVYGQIRAELWNKYAPKKNRKRNPKYMDQLLKVSERDPDCPTDERDLLIASMAVERNYVLVTDDSHGPMKRILEAAHTVAQRIAGSGFKVENWKQPNN